MYMYICVCVCVCVCACVGVCVCVCVRESLYRSKVARFPVLPLLLWCVRMLDVHVIAFKL